MAFSSTGGDRGTDGPELVVHLLGLLAKRDATLAQRDATLAARDATLAARDEQLAALAAENEALAVERRRLERAYEQLKEELLLVKRRLFIAKSERIDTAQLELEFVELSKKLEALAGELSEGEGEGDSSADDPRSKKKKKPKGRRNLADANLPEEVVEVTDEVFEQLVAEGRPSALAPRRAIGWGTSAAAFVASSWRASSIASSMRGASPRWSRHPGRPNSSAGGWPRPRSSRTS